MRKLNKTSKKRLLVWLVTFGALLIVFILLLSLAIKGSESNQKPINHIETALESHSETVIKIDKLYQKEEYEKYVKQRDAKWKEQARIKRAEEIEKRRLARVEREKRVEKARLAKLEQDRKNRLAEKSKKQVASAENSNNGNVGISRSGEYKGVNQNLGTFNVSWYGANCDGCSGWTSAGVDVRNTITHNGYGVAAADWSILPPYSIVEVQGYGRYIVLDKGGAIKGSRLDLLTTSEAKSNEYGRQHLNVTVLRWGK